LISTVAKDAAAPAFPVAKPELVDKAVAALTVKVIC
jgi:hypothetical protein